MACFRQSTGHRGMPLVDNQPVTDDNPAA